MDDFKEVMGMFKKVAKEIDYVKVSFFIGGF